VSRPTLDSNRSTSCVNDVRGNAVPSATLPPATLRGVVCATTTVDGFTREYLVYLPERVRSPAPLVIMYHGSSGTGPQFFWTSGWREQADANGLVAIFPTGLEYLVLDEGRVNTKWNDFNLASEVDLARKPRGYPAGAPWPTDDVKFTRLMIENVSRLLSVDGSRIFVSGFSNGAGLVQRLSVEASDVIDAVAGHFSMLQAAMTPKARISRFLTVGNRDDRLITALGLTSPLPMTLEGFRAIGPLGAGIRNELMTWQLEDPPSVTTPRPGVTQARWTRPQAGNASGNVLSFAVLEGLGHQYANGRNSPVVAAAVFWSFFMDPSSSPAW
jgi:poly(3-hydroxybutyrate) depolymerase